MPHSAMISMNTASMQLRICPHRSLPVPRGHTRSFCTGASAVETSSDNTEPPKPLRQEVIPLLKGTGAQMIYHTVVGVAFNKVLRYIPKAESQVGLGLMVLALMAKFSYVFCFSATSHKHPTFTIRTFLRRAAKGESPCPEDMQVPEWFPRLVSGWKARVILLLAPVMAFFSINAALLVFLVIGHLGGLPFWALSLYQAFRDNLRHRAEDPRRAEITLGHLHACSRPLVNLHSVVTVLFFIVNPIAGFLILPSLCCTILWIRLLKALSKLNGDDYLVPQRDIGSDEEPAKGVQNSLWFILGISSLVEACFWMLLTSL